MKRKEQIRNKALELYPDQFYSSIAQRSGAENVDNSEKREIFIKACEWADAHPDLYSVTRKAVEREREYLMKKIAIWLDNNFITHDEYGVMSYQFDTVEEMIEDFKKEVRE
jgi:hypothetical protein